LPTTANDRHHYRHPNRQSPPLIVALDSRSLTTTTATQTLTTATDRHQPVDHRRQSPTTAANHHRLPTIDR